MDTTATVAGGPGEEQGVTEPLDREIRPVSFSRTILLSAWVGLLTGLIELIPLFLRIQFAQNGLYRRSSHIIWMAPVANLLIFLGVGVVLALFVRPIPRIGQALSAGLLGTLAFFSVLLSIPGLKAYAGIMLAIGISSWAVPLLRVRANVFGRFMARSAPVMGGLVLILAGVAFAKPLMGSWSASPHPLAPVSSDQPNVLLVVMDTVRADATSLHGSSRETTPNLVKLAKEGVSFDRAISTAPWTLPSHASMFTGRWSWELQVGPGRPLGSRYPTLAGYMKDQGYATAGFIANTFLCTAEYGLAQGFEHYEDYLLTPLELLRSSSLGWLISRGTGSFLDRLAPVLGQVPRHPFETNYERKSAEQINASALQWVAQKRDTPFFVFLNYFDVHDPYLVPETGRRPHFGETANTLAQRRILRDWITEQPRERTAAEMSLARDAYDDCLAYLDDQIGRLLDGLDRLGRLENTIVIVTSDHGEHFGEHTREGFPMVGHRLSVYQPEIHVPLVIVAPGKIQPATRIRSAASLRDLPATIVDLAKLKGTSPFPGKSLLTELQSDGTSAEFVSGSVALSEFTPKTDVISATPEQLRTLGLMRAVVTDEKTYHRHGDGLEELFDLQTDPGETKNLIKQPAASAELKLLKQSFSELVPREVEETEKQK